MGRLLQLATERTDDTWLTKRRLVAYLVLGAVNPALLAAGAEFAASRATEIDRIEAALHLSESPDAAAFNFILGVMRQDADAKERRVAQAGW